MKNLGVAQPGRALRLERSCRRFESDHPDHLDDDGKLVQKWRMKKFNARKESIGFGLTIGDFTDLLMKAGIKSSDLGVRGFHLARNNDEGDYVVGNCSFIWWEENLRQKKVSQKARDASSAVMKRLHSRISEDNVLRDRHGQSVLAGTEESRRKRKILMAVNYVLRRLTFEANSPSYAGKKNSQSGTFWIPNGQMNKKWRLTLGDIPVNFVRGRTCNRGG